MCWWVRIEALVGPRPMTSLANGIATKQYAAAERVAQVAADATQVAALQRVVVVAHRAA